MDPLNAQERSTAFMKFLSVFVVTLLIALVAAFIAMQIPKKEKADLAKQKEQLERELRTQGIIKIKMDSIEHWLIELDAKNASVNMLDTKISNMIVEMEAYQNDSSNFGKIMFKANEAYTALKNEKMSMHRNNDQTNETIGILKESIKLLKEQLKTCEEALVD
ncbi:MAG: type VI secretion system TssO [Flavobacteriales bacterium]